MKRFFSAIAVSVAVCFLTLVSTTAQEKSVKPGINKQFENPNPDDWTKKFEGESREIAANAKEIVAACKIKPGMVVADIGSGTGLFTCKFAAEVGEKGKVFAVDVAPTFLAHIKKTCEENKIKNVETILCDQSSTKLPKNSVDLVFICDTYHHFEFPQRTLQSIHDALRPGGQIVLIDFHRIKGKSSDFVMGHVRAGQEVFVAEVKSAGFKVTGEEKLLKENYFVRFEKKELMQGKLDLHVVPTPIKEKRWCKFIDVPKYGKLFGFMGGPIPHKDRLYFSLSTYNGTDIGCDGKPYHFCNAMLEFDPQACRFEFPTLEAKDAYHQVAYMVSAKGEFFATGSNILEKNGKLNRDRAGEVVFWQTVKPKRALEFFKEKLDKTLTPAKAVSTFGEPDRKLGSGLIIYEYDLHDCTKIRLAFPGFAPILGVQHVQKDGKFVDIPIK